MDKRVLVALVLASLTILVAGCAAGPNSLKNTPGEEGQVAGFWRGLWHGIISPITFVVSLFSETVRMYEVHNNGGWYDFGFLLGVGIPLGGGCGASRRRRRD